MPISHYFFQGGQKEKQYTAVEKRHSFLGERCLQLCIYCLFIIWYSFTKKRNVQPIQLCVKNATKMQFLVQRYSYRRLLLVYLFFRQILVPSLIGTACCPLISGRDKLLIDCCDILRSFFTHEFCGKLWDDSNVLFLIAFTLTCIVFVIL